MGEVRRLSSFGGTIHWRMIFRAGRDLSFKDGGRAYQKRVARSLAGQYAAACRCPGAATGEFQFTGSAWGPLDLLGEIDFKFLENSRLKLLNYLVQLGGLEPPTS
jgi:hypothetical protein